MEERRKKEKTARDLPAGIKAHHGQIIIKMIFVERKCRLNGIDVCDRGRVDV